MSINHSFSQSLLCLLMEIYCNILLILFCQGSRPQTTGKVLQVVQCDTWKRSVIPVLCSSSFLNTPRNALVLTQIFDDDTLMAHYPCWLSILFSNLGLNLVQLLCQVPEASGLTVVVSSPASNSNFFESGVLIGVLQLPTPCSILVWSSCLTISPSKHMHVMLHYQVWLIG